MALRQVNIYVPAEQSALPEMSDQFDLIDRWDYDVTDERRAVHVLVETGNTEALIQWLHDQFVETENYRIVVKSVEATLPRPDADEEDEDEEDDADAQRPPFAPHQQKGDVDESKAVSRISREEVYQSVKDSISVTNVYYTLVFLSTIVAAGGMIRDSTAVVIGAMVIAPIIGPNIALALGSTLADTDLLKQAMKVNVTGLALGLAIAVAVGAAIPFDPTVEEIATRSEVNVADVALALAAGAAGVLSVTRGISTALIGVMVAVALLPPLVAIGLHIGIADWSGAYGAALLTATNVVAINIAGVVTFLVQGIRPLTWYEEEKAKRARGLALVLWFSILALLTLLILLRALPTAP